MTAPGTDGARTAGQERSLRPGRLPSDPLVHALVVCIRQAHQRRQARVRLDDRRPREV